MISEEIRKAYIPTIGVECHVQLKTSTKLFAGVGNDARDAAPNTLISHICLGMPGALPVLNEKAIELAMRASLALNTTPQKFSKFDRKHYFYPDLPKGYQITQYDQPIILGGEVETIVGGKAKKVRITRAHLEEDAGKSTHPAGKDYSLVDLNRAGTPLLEIVSEPDMHSPEETKAYAKELYLLMRYADVSDADLFHGNMRFDVNVSVSKDPNKLGTRTETKNLNSFRSVEKAVEYEINRQIEELEKGHSIIQETRGWDDAKQKTFSQRSKEEAHDYRYFPEPDLPPVEIDNSATEAIKKTMPVLPSKWRERLSKLGLDNSQIETLIDAEVESEKTNRLPIVQAHLDEPELAKALANWMVNIEIPLEREGKIEQIIVDEVRERLYLQVHELVKTNKLSSTNAKQLLTTILSLGIAPEPLEKYAEEQGLIQVSNEKEISAIVDRVLFANPQAAEDLKNGQEKVIGFLVGQVMKESLGRANPELAQKLLKKQLGL
ncbi:MAG TPA: Asp-tRNA(Asn)/Glu-tRNA(Gln) amidotransferase subunit GatB [Patescibacteria group bacterium]|nr:Asp-tRNA(Asn)/Glu-tRNA(Gln) amidotransferase subunit GatB [Patescibacteria group bacterium]